MGTSHTRHFLGLALAALAAFAAAGAATAAEIVLERSAVDKLVAQGMFANAGRYDIVKGPCFSYLDRPSVTISNGRVRIRSHLTARLGEVLADIRVDKVDDPNLRMVLESGLVPALPRVIEFDVLKSVRSMLQDNGGQFQANVDAFAIDSVTAADDRLSVRFDFLLVAR